MFIALLIFGGACTSVASAQSQPPDLPGYTATVREALAAAQRNDRFGLQQAGTRLANTTSVRLPDGAQVPVDNRWLQAEIQKSDPDFTLLSDRLGALVDALAQPASAAPADARARLQQILTNPPFQSSQPSQPSWLRQFLDWLGRLLERLLRPVGETAQNSSGAITWTVALIGGLLLAAVIGYLLLGLRRTMVRDANLASDDPEANMTAKVAFDQASALARGGDYRTAVRYLYLAALLRLDERGLLRYDRALTNREYLEQVRDNPALQERLMPVVATFDRVWYGHVPLDAAAFAANRAQVEALAHEKMTG
jgi:hypothetical protein